MNVTERQIFGRSPSRTRTRAIGTKCFCFAFVFCFLFSFTVVLNKDENEPNNTSCPTDTLLRPRRKTLCRDHLQQILNTSNMEIIHHLVVLATIHFCVVRSNMEIIHHLVVLATIHFCVMYQIKY